MVNSKTRANTVDPDEAVFSGSTLFANLNIFIFGSVNEEQQQNPSLLYFFGYKMEFFSSQTIKNI